MKGAPMRIVKQNPEAFDRLVAAADAMRESLYVGLETVGAMEQEWSKHDRQLVASYDIARAALAKVAK
jgi:hypothetical protein